MHMFLYVLNILFRKDDAFVLQNVCPPIFWPFQNKLKIFNFSLFIEDMQWFNFFVLSDSFNSRRNPLLKRRLRTLRGSLQLSAACETPGLSLSCLTPPPKPQLFCLNNALRTPDGSAGCLRERSQGFTQAIEGICSYLSIWVTRIQKLFSVADKKSQVPPRTDSIRRGVVNDTSSSSRNFRVVMSR